MWKALNSNFAIFALGFVFVTIFGTWLTDRFQSKSWEYQIKAEADRRAYEWEREKTFQLLQHRLTEGVASLERISEAMNSRLFRAQQVFYDLQSNQKRNKQFQAEYRESVDLWNTRLNFFETELTRLIGDQYARELNAYETDVYAQSSCPANPPSIHAKFWCIHSALNRLLDCGECDQKSAIVNQLASYLRAVDYQIDNFVVAAGNDFLRQTAALDEFTIDVDR